MSIRRRKIIRWIIGPLVGAIMGFVVAVGIIVLTILVCAADGGQFLGRPPQHAWVNTVINPVFDTLPGLFALACVGGALMGLVWANQQNRREPASSEPDDGT